MARTSSHSPPGPGYYNVDYHGSISEKKGSTFAGAPRFERFSRERKRELIYNSKFCRAAVLVPVSTNNNAQRASVKNKTTSKARHINRNFALSNREEDKNKPGYVAAAIPRRSISAPHLFQAPVAVEKKQVFTERDSDSSSEDSDGDDSDCGVSSSASDKGNDGCHLVDGTRWGESDEFVDKGAVELTPGPGHYFKSHPDSSFGGGANAWRPSSKASQFCHAKRWSDKPKYEWKQLGSAYVPDDIELILYKSDGGRKFAKSDRHCLKKETTPIKKVDFIFVDSASKMTLATQVKSSPLRFSQCFVSKQPRLAPTNPGSPCSEHIGPGTYQDSFNTLHRSLHNSLRHSSKDGKAQRSASSFVGDDRGRVMRRKLFNSSATASSAILGQ